MTRRRQRQPHRRERLKSTNDHRYTKPRGQVDYELFTRLRRKLRNLQRMRKIYDWFTYWENENHLTGERDGLIVAIQFYHNSSWTTYTVSKFLQATKREFGVIER